MTTENDLILSAIADGAGTASEIEGATGLERKVIYNRLGYMRQQGALEKVDGVWRVTGKAPPRPAAVKARVAAEGDDRAPKPKAKKVNGAQTPKIAGEANASDLPSIPAPTRRELEFAIAESGAVLFKVVAGDKRGQLGEINCADALARRYEVLLLEGLDRLSRDAVEQESVVRRLEHRGIRIIGVSDSYDSAAGKGRKLLRGVRGLINEAYLEDLADKVHRGLAGQLARGYHAGGLSYGYRSVVVGVNARGEPIGHRLEVVPQQAEVLREIYRRYAAGESCQALAHDLNARGVPGPRGGTWSVSALYGSPAKGAGILNNELYIGRYVWNRSKWVKEPDTGRRARIDRPREEWIVEERPELRILTDVEWQAARQRMATPRRSGGRKGRGAAPSTLFGGLLRCGICGGAIIAINGAHYGCVSRKDRGPAVCTGVSARRDRVDSALVEHVRAELLAPASLAKLEAEVRQALARRRTNAAEARRSAGARRAELEREIARLVDAIATVGLSPALQARLARAESDLAGLQDGPQGAPEARQVVSAIRARLRAAAADLGRRLSDDTARARPVLQELFGEIRLEPDGKAVYAVFESAADRLLVAAGGVSLGMVAGECNMTRLRVR